MARVLTGLDRVAQGEFAELFKNRRIGLLAHPASVTSSLVTAQHVLENAGATIHVLFGPEHGYGGEKQDMVEVASQPPQGAAQRLATYSLYGKTEEELKPRKEWLKDLDAVVIDLQDVGSRYYTFVWSAALMLKAAAEMGVPAIVLDRPNPLGGSRMEGMPQRSGYRSFVGLYDVPVRHGMTLAELCKMVLEVEGLDEPTLTIIPMQGWQREMLWPETRLPWVMPSPNMPSFETAQVYPGGCLIEGTMLSEGRGTTRPFEIWGAPYVDPSGLLPTPGCLLRTLSFQPTFGKHMGRICRGVQVHISDADLFEPYASYLKWLFRIRQQARGAFEWRKETYEFVKDRLAIDLLTGGPEFRESITTEGDLEYWLVHNKQQVTHFAQRRRAWLLY